MTVVHCTNLALCEIKSETPPGRAAEPRMSSATKSECSGAKISPRTFQCDWEPFFFLEHVSLTCLISKSVRRLITRRVSGVCDKEYQSVCLWGSKRPYGFRPNLPQLLYESLEPGTRYREPPTPCPSSLAADAAAERQSRVPRLPLLQCSRCGCSEKCSLPPDSPHRNTHSYPTFAYIPTPIKHPSVSRDALLTGPDTKFTCRGNTQQTEK
ncbi:unnamed protein product [Acanthoscelides obtectus]|uniref:Uncharacterized protein n=1 Tax=Acanthoscelides obtectus TaxID=200917 RepID=A0A9P0P4H2_ACAOB|nr:unnamed protein product [Acanthoscelides obtectus]CAK1629086.1 hypothetical protein AOBTE_LOCUS5568 [Acanthoscelides obtectus]